MKKTILTIATIATLFTSCTKEDDLQPVAPQVEVECLDVCGTIIAMRHDMTNGTDAIESQIQILTRCDTVEVLRVHDLSVIYSNGQDICFDRNELINQ